MRFNFHRIANFPLGLRLLTFVLLLLVFWLPVAIPIYLLVTDSNLVSIITMLILYAEFIILLKFWGKLVYQKPNLLNRYGLQLNVINAQELLQGLILGFGGVLSLFLIEGILGWLTWENPLNKLPLLGRFLAEGFAVGMGVGCAEELIFRGWLLDELERDYKPQIATVINTFLFAILHFIKPLEAMIKTAPQFPGLLLLGLTLILAKRGSQGRLGLSIGLHAGLVWGYYLINVGELVKYSPAIPDWLVGVNRNPLAGLMGLLFLTLIAVGMRVRYQKNRAY